MAISGENIAVISKVLNHTTLATTAIYARLNLAPVKTALNKHADMLLGLGGAPLAPQPIQTMVLPPTRGEERDEWPG